MNLRFIVIPLVVCLLGTVGTNSTSNIMWHLDCPVIAHWCAPSNTDACRQIRPSDEYDFFVSTINNGNHTAIIKFTAIPAAFVLPVTLTPAPQPTPRPSPPPPPQPSVFSLTSKAEFTETAVTWSANLGNVSASFVLWRASQRLIVTTTSPETQIDWEGTCAKVANKLLTATPAPTPKATPKTSSLKSTPKPPVGASSSF